MDFENEGFAYKLKQFNNKFINVLENKFRQRILKY